MGALQSRRRAAGDTANEDPDHCAEDGGVWLYPRSPRLQEQRQRMLPLSAARARSDCAIVANDARFYALSPHLPEQRQSPVPLLALPARADPSVVADDVGLQLRLPHLAEQRQGPLSLSTFLAGAGPGVEAHYPVVS